MSHQSRQFVLADLPKGKLSPEHFRMETAEVGSPGKGEVLVRTRYTSLDAANRAWMQGATYRSALEGGQVMAGGGLGEVVESGDDDLKPGDLVSGDLGWRELGVHSAKGLQKQPAMEPLSHLLSVYGITGLTAYFGLLKIGDPKPGETVLVSAAAGAVGNVVGQIARIKGCRAVGVCGDDAKGQWLVDELGFDAYVNYKTGPLNKNLKAACPDGIDVYFDNTGGDILEATLFQMNMHGRISCCGAVSAYDGAAPAAGPRGVPGMLVVKRLLMQGFIVMDFNADIPTALKDLQSWVQSGQLKVVEDVIEGFENLPDALIGLLAGQNRGKRMVHVS